MTALVVDASVALAWAFPDENNHYADVVLASLLNRSIRVPEVWPREIANSLAMAYRRGRITAEDESKFLKQLSLLTIDIQQLDAVTTIRNGVAAASLFNLTAYDAAYVDLAMREDLELATLDNAMRRAAIVAGVVLF